MGKRLPVVHCVLTIEHGEGISDEDREKIADGLRDHLLDYPRLVQLYGEINEYSVVVEVDHQ